LRSWQYVFGWGSASYYYDSIQLPGRIGISPSYHHQIRDWNELLLQCDYIASQEVSSDEVVRDNLPALKAAIDAIRPHFDYQQVRPRAYPNGLIFEFEQRPWKPTKPRIQLHVNAHRSDGVYRVSRLDRLEEKVYTSDLQDMVNKLQEYIANARF
jgi:hypothetical protein